MKNTKFLVSLTMVFAVLIAQVRVVFAAPALITGTVQSITLEANTNTAVTTVLITVMDNGESQTVRITLESAITLGIIILGADGNPVINELILGQPVEIDPTTVITDKQMDQHPVGSALATFFSDIIDLDYETIMAAHEDGTGFGVIAQALWLTRKLDGDAAMFVAIIDAKRTKDFSAFVLEDGTIPQNWGQFKKIIMDGKKGKPGIAMADQDNNGNNNGNGNGNGNGKDKEKDKDEKQNNGRGNDN
jgi:hypothetical protein